MAVDDRRPVLCDRVLGRPPQFGDVLLEVPLVRGESWAEWGIKGRGDAKKLAHAIGGKSAHEPEVLDRLAQGIAQMLQFFGGPLDPVERNEQPQHFIRPLENSLDARVAQPALVRLGLAVAAPAGHLHHLVGGAPDQFARKDLADRRLQRQVRLVAIEAVGEQAEHRLRRVDLGGELRHLALRDLEVRQRMPELHALLGVARHLAEQLLCAARASRGERQPSAVQHVHGDGKSLAHGAKDVVVRHAQVLVRQLHLRRPANAELLERSGHAEPRHVGPHDERRRTQNVLAVPLDFCLRKGRDHAGAMPVADPDLAPVQRPRAIAVPRGARLDILGVRSGLRLGQRVRRQIVATREGREVAGLLLGVAVHHDRLGPEATVHADQHAK